jgi:hypothetical protein
MIIDVIIPYIFSHYESNKAIWMFYEKFADEGNTQWRTQTSIM